MKKIISLIMIIGLLCGCGGKMRSAVTRQISFTADITYYNEQFKAAVETDGSGNMIMELLSPEDIAGLKFIVSKDEIKALMMGLTYSPDTDNMPSAIAASCIYEMLSEAGEMKFKVEEKNGVLKGNACDRPFTLTVSAAGYPIEGAIPDDRFDVKFSDVT